MPIETRTRFSPDYRFPAKGRLQRARKAAVDNVAKILARYGAETGEALEFIRRGRYDDWRRQRAPRLNMASRGHWQRPDDVKRPENREYYADSLDCLAWRQCGRADEVSRKEGSRRVNHSGWFTDSFHLETVAGYVLQLPARDGRPRYVPAIQWSCNDSATVRPLDVYDSALDAAGAADRWAEREAESEREYQTAWQAGSQWADLGADIASTRRELLAILAERRKVKGLEAPALCAAITDSVHRLLDDIREAREERSRLSQGDCRDLIFYPGEGRLREAFNEGAGAIVLA